MTEADRRRGVVLVTVLWSIAVLSALAMAASVTFREFAGVMAVGRDRVQGEALLTAGLEVAAGLLAESGDRPPTEMETTVDLSIGSVRARLADEGGRIDIGRAPTAVLAALLRAVGAPEKTADALAQRIVDHRGPAEPGRAVTARRPDRPPGLDPPFTDVRQLAAVAGMTPEWVAAMAPLTTVFGNETVNPMTAPAAVIAALPGVERRQLDAFLAMRRSSSPDAERLRQLLGPAQQYLSVRPQRVASVELTARLPDGFQTAARAVIVLLPRDRQPYRVLLWQPLSWSRLL
jgi:general secretion pathway protein K